MNNSKNIGSYLKRIRLLRGKTQTEFGNFLQIDQRTLSKYETSGIDSLSEIDRISEEIGVDLLEARKFKLSKGIFDKDGRFVEGLREEDIKEYVNAVFGEAEADIRYKEAAKLLTYSVCLYIYFDKKCPSNEKTISNVIRLIEAGIPDEDFNYSSSALEAILDGINDIEDVSEEMKLANKSYKRYKTIFGNINDIAIQLAYSVLN